MTMEQIKKDVVVVGGGPGGFAAAVTAARAGAQVLLVERNGYLGGQLGSGLPFLAFWDIKGRQVVGGIAQPTPPVRYTDTSLLLQNSVL